MSNENMTKVNLTLDNLLMILSESVFLDIIKDEQEKRNLDVKHNAPKKKSRSMMFNSNESK